MKRIIVLAIVLAALLATTVAAAGMAASRVGCTVVEPCYWR